jgi:hypothetical protein
LSSFSRRASIFPWQGHRLFSVVIPVC